VNMGSDSTPVLLINTISNCFASARPTGAKSTEYWLRGKGPLTPVLGLPWLDLVRINDLARSPFNPDQASVRGLKTGLSPIDQFDDIRFSKFSQTVEKLDFRSDYYSEGSQESLI
ncbi:hypothetical protein, partial [Moorena sp. SIO3I6]|uniref:hypothetical protein n=1 Tax=Moorena sp. SIO3I6 TaxID=2607831 RepID=UPI0025E17034